MNRKEQKVDDDRLFRNIHREHVDRFSLGKDYEPGPYDVICQRGRRSYNHVGCRRFRVLVGANVDEYKLSDTSRDEKRLIIKGIVSAVRSAGGHFVRKDEATNEWFEVGDEVARDKTSHALRDVYNVLEKKVQRKRSKSKLPTTSATFATMKEAPKPSNYCNHNNNRPSLSPRRKKQQQQQQQQQPVLSLQRQSMPLQVAPCDQQHQQHHHYQQQQEEEESVKIPVLKESMTRRQRQEQMQKMIREKTRYLRQEHQLLQQQLLLQQQQGAQKQEKLRQEDHQHLQKQQQQPQVLQQPQRNLQLGIPGMAYVLVPVPVHLLSSFVAAKSALPLPPPPPPSSSAAATAFNPDTLNS